MPAMHEASLESGAMNETEREKVREQLHRLLDSHHFKNSRRYPALLRFIVEETLEGRGEYLKERLLGVRVFDRPADYDTASDPIVRVTIAEIRKRIAQYYHDEEHDAEMRIELQPGRYAPEFRARSARREPAWEGNEASALAEVRPLIDHAEKPSSAHASTAQPSPPRAAPPGHSRRFAWLTGGLAALLLLALASVLLARWIRPSALDALWTPFLASQHSVLFCVPTDVGRKRGPVGTPEDLNPPSADRQLRTSSAGGPTFLDYEALGENVVYSDMLAALRIESVIAQRHRDYRVRLNVATTLEDLRQGPTVLIGGLDNQWTIRALSGLRFRFAGSDEDRYWISDTQNPGNRTWSLDLKQQYKAVTRDYAIISRLHNDQTGQPEMIVAGIGMSGTAAAGEFVTDERQLEALRQRIGPALKDHDFEAVLSTDVVNGIAGSPKILAVSVW
jgi:hypothetical protein